MFRLNPNIQHHTNAISLFFLSRALGAPGGEIGIVVWCGVYLCSNAKLFLKISQYFGLVKLVVWFGLVFFPPVNIFCPFHNVMALISLFFLFNTMHIFDLLPCLPLSSNGSACRPTPQQAFFMCVLRKGILWCCLQLPAFCLNYFSKGYAYIWFTLWYPHNSLVNKREKVKC